MFFPKQSSETKNKFVKKVNISIIKLGTFEIKLNLIWTHSVES